MTTHGTSEAKAAVLKNGVNVPNPDLNGPQVANSVNLRQKYDEERTKRLKPEGNSQYIDLRQSDKHKEFIEDPWIQPGTTINTPIPSGKKVKVVIVGAGWGGMSMAIKLLQSGFNHEDIIIVDPAGGFGGTWYWNRYPGLMCDVESYVYLPMLEETGYVPKHKYCFGQEIREYAELLAKKYGLNERAMFQSSVKEVVWNEDKKEWDVKITKKPKGEQESDHAIRADFFVFASGVLNNPKLADLPGMLDYKGHSFHTARWDYTYTGGSQANPELTGLKGKKVALVGTGATAIQATPHLAKFAKELYVFQRTPSSIDARNNRETNTSNWEKDVATGKGWWQERNKNFLTFIQDDPHRQNDMVDDGWTHMPSYSALVGTPREVTPNNMGEHIEHLHSMDGKRTERIHQRVDSIVEDESTAQSLKAWYPGWCKRPCFHDEYLPTFNLPHVHLIDTDGKGIEKVTSTGLVANGKEYDVDLIIWSTGFRSPVVGTAAGKSDVVVKGRGGIDIEEKAAKMEFKTLHGVCAKDFPNMFYLGAVQGATSANFTYTLDTAATHVAYILSTAHTQSTRTTNGAAKPNAHQRPIIEPTHEAQEAWGIEIAKGAPALAGMGGCTPSYFNLEGVFDKMPPEVRMKAAALGLWGKGFPAYLEVIEGWRKDGRMEGLDVVTVN